jgi:hypothetical protein
MGSRTADFSTREDTLSVTTETSLATVYTNTRIGLTPFWSTALAIRTTCESTVACRATFTAGTDLTFIAGDTSTKVDTALGSTFFTFTFTGVEDAPWDTNVIGAE